MVAILSPGWRATTVGRTYRTLKGCEMAAQIEVGDVEQGHSLTGLDHGYVIEVQRQDGCLSVPVGRFSTRLPDDYVCLTFNDADGGECYLIAPADMRVMVDDATPQWVG